MMFMVNKLWLDWAFQSEKQDSSRPFTASKEPPTTKSASSIKSSSVVSSSYNQQNASNQNQHAPVL